MAAIGADGVFLVFAAEAEVFKNTAAFSAAELVDRHCRYLLEGTLGSSPRILLPPNIETGILSVKGGGRGVAEKGQNGPFLMGNQTFFLTLKTVRSYINLVQKQLSINVIAATGFYDSRSWRNQRGSLRNEDE
jgi:hypothetical protein